MTQRSRRDRMDRRLRVECLEERRVLSTVTVSTTSDVVDGDAIHGIAALIANPGPDGKISAREAIDAAGFTPGADIINFSTNPADGLNGGTILLTQGELSINDPDSLTIDASMLSSLTIDANDPTPMGQPGDVMGDGFRIFDITDTTFGSLPSTVTMVGLTLTGGDVSSSMSSAKVERFVPRVSWC